MYTCPNHPDREARFVCMKDNVRMCEECAHCRNPEIYCKYRTSCPIWFMRKGEEEWGGAPETKETAAAETPPEA